MKQNTQNITSITIKRKKFGDKFGEKHWRKNLGTKCGEKHWRKNLEKKNWEKYLEKKLGNLCYDAEEDGR
jgi:hypothetical protein